MTARKRAATRPAPAPVDVADLKARLIEPRADTDSGMPEDTVEIPGIGHVVVRGLSRGEVFVMQKARADGRIKTEEHWERRLLSLAMVIPPLTEAEVGKWQGVCPAGELDPVAQKVRELSGLREDADKSDLQGLRGESGPGVRALPGDEAVDDGGPAAPGDAG